MQPQCETANFRSVLSVAALVLLACAGPAIPQTAKQDAFQSLLADPANPALMLRYAQLATAEGDYEAAISTLERLIDVEPANQNARLELSKAYFALGQNQLAEFHLNIYRERGQLTAAEQREAEAFTDAVEKRQSPITTAGRAEAGLLYRNSEDDFGASFDLNLSIDIDLGTANNTRWDTDFALTALRFPDNSFDHQTAALIRTGPVISIDGKVVGAQIRPFVEMVHLETDDTEVAGTSLAFGVEYANVIDASWAVNAELIRGEVDRDGAGFDSEFFGATLGGQYRATQEIGFVATLRYLDEDEDPGGLDIEARGVSFGASHDFSGSLLGIGQSWSLSGFVRHDWDEYGDGREDETLGLGASLMTNLNDTAYIRSSVRSFDRTSSDSAFDDDDVLVSVEVGMEF